MDRNICITISASKWKDYEKYDSNVEDTNKIVNVKCGRLPAKAERNSIRRCYLCCNDTVVGWERVVGFKEEDKSNYIMISGPLHKLRKQQPMKGFRGFKYVDF